MCEEYILPNIRTLLVEGFQDQELRRLCRENGEFRAVYYDLSPNLGKAGVVDLLLAHAEAQMLMETLLAWAKERNPRRYEIHKPYCRSEQPDKPPLPPPHELTRIRILFLAANPTDTTRLRLGEEIRSIGEVLRGTEFRDQFDLEQEWAVRVDDLQECLLRHSPHVVHFSGHGGIMSHIMLEDEGGRGYEVPPRALSNLFSLLKDNIRCVLLNACYSERQARAIAEHIDCVVGMSRTIKDKAAIRFSVAFYQALGYGRDVDTAFKLACNQLELQNMPDADVPQLIAPNCDPSMVVLVETGSRRPGRDDRTGSGTQARERLASTRNTGTHPAAGSAGAEQREMLAEELAQHQRNLARLRRKKAVYAAGEEPLHVVNQIEAEEHEIERVRSELLALAQDG